jgi:Ca2+-transporting ATPase
MDSGLDLKDIPALSDEEAARRFAEEGPNELPAALRKSWSAIAGSVIREPMFLLLLACGALYLSLGDLEEAGMLLGFVFVVMGITFSQERKSERALEALRELSSPRAMVIRGGVKRRIPGREVVRGDIVILSEGDRVPADGLVLSGANLMADESLLTGESVPVRKRPAEEPVQASPPGGDDLPFVYSGTLVVRGQGVARVAAVGSATEMGRIGRSLQEISDVRTPLQAETRRLVARLAWVGVSLCVAVAVLYGLRRGQWLDGFLAGLALAMAVLPEEFPVVLTIFLALGAWRMSKRRVLTRRMPAVEALGSATVLCVDKTGTITLNRMSVEKIVSADGRALEVADAQAGLPENFHALMEFAVLASQSDPFDPMEKAINRLARERLARTEHLHGDWRLVREYPLSRDLLSLSHVWRSPDRSEFVIAAKGAPESIASLCHMPPDAWARVAAQVQALAEGGLRVLGVARARFAHGALPDGQHDFPFDFLGLLGLADPVRPSVASAMAECRAAGVRVVMITGDHPATALHVARAAGLDAQEGVISGSELLGMDGGELRRRISGANLFARVAPEQKLNLVEALKANGEVVAMTGDGVNDAPALKAAHIGVAMGGRGTDVAREAADLVLLDDDFSAIVGAVRMGRRIFDNIRKAVAYVLAIHVPIVGMSLLPVLCGWPLMLLPVHIVLLELIIDPACSVVFEAEPAEPDVMLRPPRDPREPLFSRATVELAVFQGVGVLLAVLAVFALARRMGQGEAEIRALTFTALVAANLALILTNRSWERTIPQSLRVPRSEERRVGKECRRLCRSRWSPYH